MYVGNKVVVDMNETEDTGNNYNCTFLIIITCLIEFQDVTLPHKMKKRGRPKGAEKTVIGLPRKKNRPDKPVPFLKKLPVDRERGSYQSCLSMVYYAFACTF